MKKSLYLFALILFTIAGNSGSLAATITFMHQGNGSGTLGGQSFLTTSFTIMAIGDTGDRQIGSFGDGFFIEHTSAFISIDGLGSYSLLSPTRTFVSHDGQLVGFGRPGILGLDLFNGPIDAQLSDWDMLGSIGPLSGEGGLLQWDSSPRINTNSGFLMFAENPTSSVFSAAVVPEPSSFTLLALAFTAYALSSRSSHRCKKA